MTRVHKGFVYIDTSTHALCNLRWSYMKRYIITPYANMTGLRCAAANIMQGMYDAAADFSSMISVS